MPHHTTRRALVPVALWGARHFMQVQNGFSGTLRDDA